MSDTPKFQWSQFDDEKNGQFVIRTDNWQELTEYRLKAQALLSGKSEVVTPSMPITQPQKPIEKEYTVSNADTAPLTDEVPVCSFHGTPMTSRKGTYGFFWSCGRKDRGVWCKGKPRWLSSEE